MTIPTEVAELKIDTVDGTDPIDLTSEFGALYFLTASDLRVQYVDPDGNEFLWEFGDDYTISGNGAVGEGVLQPVTETAAGGHLCIWRETPLVQPDDYEENDGFPAETIERQEDRLILIAQDTRRLVLKALRVCDCDPPLENLGCAPSGMVVFVDGVPKIVEPPAESTRIFQLCFEFDGVDAEILAGAKRKNYLDFEGEIVGWVVQAEKFDDDADCAIEFDVRMKAYADDAPATGANSIVADAPPELLTGHTDKRSTAVSTWTVAVPAGSAWEAEIITADNIGNVTLNLLIKRGVLDLEED